MSLSSTQSERTSNSPEQPITSNSRRVLRTARLQLFLSQRGNNAVDLVNEALRIRRSSRRDKVSFNENLKHKTEAFSVECRNKTEHEMGKKAEEFAVST